MSNVLKRAVVLLSGGLDSTTVLAIAKKEGFSLYALSVDYGQRHKQELLSAKKSALEYGVEKHIVLQVDLRLFGGSALVCSDIEVPKDSLGDEIPVTYVPARNSIFLSLALAWAESLDASSIFIGVNALDYSGYPDCRPEFISSFQKTADLATRVGVSGGSISIRTPLIDMTKKQIVAKGLELGVDYSSTVTCYDLSDGIPCGSCDACVLRLKGFLENGLEDPSNELVL